MTLKFDIHFDVRTRPGDFRLNERIESFVIPVEASSYAQAQELAFAKLKAANSFEELLNSLTIGTLVTT